MFYNVGFFSPYIMNNQQDINVPIEYGNSAIIAFISKMVYLKSIKFYG